MLESSVSTDYSAYGITLGKLEEVPGPSLSCGAIISGWPTWCFGLQLRGWDLKFIIHKNSSWLSYLSAWFPSTMIIDIKQVDSISFLNSVEHWFSDVEPPRKLGLWYTTAKTITSLRRIRHLPATNWKMEQHKISHLSTGGLTDGEWSLYHYINGETSPLQIVSSRSLQDLRSVISSTIEGRPCPAPLKPIPDLPTVVQLRPNTFHGSGILPWENRNCFIITPSAFSPTSWVRRRIANQEWTSILDLPAMIFNQLSPKEKRSIIEDTTFLPLGVAFKLLDSFTGSDCRNLTAMQDLAPNPKRTCMRFIDYSSGDVTKKDEKPVDDEAPIDRESRNAISTKNDDAEIPVYLWNEAITKDKDPKKLAALDVIRQFALRWWKRQTTKDFLRWLNFKYSPTQKYSNEFLKEKKAGADCLARCANSSWWEWTAGSRPLFWRWPEEYRETIRDGVKLWIKGPLPEYRVPQRGEKDASIRKAIKNKLSIVISKGYLIQGEVKSLTSFFAVPKGDGDFRIVYDGTKSGLNNQLWAPWFPLPTIDSHLRSISPGYYMGDLDFSEMFLNFILHEKVRKYAGVDVTPFFPELVDHTKHIIWLHWERCGMGFVPSPYNSIQGVLFAEEVMKGDPSNPNNIFSWDTIILNLPGDPQYTPSKPWVYKERQKDTNSAVIANDLVTYVDDVRTSGCSYEECRQVSRRVASVANYLGLQDAARKRRDPNTSPGPWAGSIVHTDREKVEVSVSQERWNKAKGMITWISEALQMDSNHISFKTLESYRGFLIYISRTYPAMTPYLKGIHLTLDSWRPWRDDEAWKLPLSEIKAAQEASSANSSLSLDFNGQVKPPPTVKVAPRLWDDIHALSLLFASESPPRRTIRSTIISEALYMFGDASGSGFGSSLKIGNEIFYLHGQWKPSFSQESSNYRELGNLINAIKNASAKGLLKNSELFVFTDNTAAESSFYKGTSSSKRLFELTLELRKLQMNDELQLHLIHVSGKRMIAQGTDGLSRGSTYQGVMNGTPFLNYVSLHQSALDRQGSSLISWALSWFTGTDKPTILSPNDWYTKGHKHSTCIWIPPPAAADVALEQMALSIHKRPKHIHLILVPRLFTSRWRKYLGKVCSLTFTIPLGSDVWNSSNFEPLIAGIYLPLSRHKPWNLRGTPMLERVERLLREMPPTDPGWGRVVLRELLFHARSLETMSAGLVRPMLHPA